MYFGTKYNRLYNCSQVLFKYNCTREPVTACNNARDWQNHAVVRYWSSAVILSNMKQCLAGNLTHILDIFSPNCFSYDEQIINDAHFLSEGFAGLAGSFGFCTKCLVTCCMSSQYVCCVVWIIIVCTAHSHDWCLLHANIVDSDIILHRHTQSSTRKGVTFLPICQHRLVCSSLFVQIFLIYNV